MQAAVANMIVVSPKDIYGNPIDGIQYNLLF